MTSYSGRFEFVSSQHDSNLPYPNPTQIKIQVIRVDPNPIRIQSESKFANLYPKIQVGYEFRVWHWLILFGLVGYESTGLK